ncbi:phosphate signaling complex protein PhoU [Lacisediminihabitans profunda]|uniref:Phosphate-specific transport system accessory protein PhoU n=1 Tax=Lacisediminihabitans profunda TaxID=2594790 RepID=A0A5C8UVH0_9MICO|nr:phosphate signaling complex protein PhoU [Lacisediminihabitans profunda]TXN32674.1 phosphate signaling complex protein PhoU [Lacisediminihabitans profunda]
MREVFQQELQEVQERLVEIATLVEISIENATRAFNESNVSLAEAVIADDDKIDGAAVALDELAINILARQQPVARDLRIVVSALRISASLERMGDMAEHIAQLARYRFPDKVVPRSLRSTFADLGKYDVQIAKKLTELLRTEDMRLAEEIRNDDDQIDALHLSVFDKVLGETWKGAAVDTVDATLASRYHERFADHAVSIAKKVQYLATGDWVSAGL